VSRYTLYGYSLALYGFGRWALNARRLFSQVFLLPGTQRCPVEDTGIRLFFSQFVPLQYESLRKAEPHKSFSELYPLLCEHFIVMATLFPCELLQDVGTTLHRIPYLIFYSPDVTLCDDFSL